MCIHTHTYIYLFLSLSLYIYMPPALQALAHLAAGGLQPLRKTLETILRLG